MIGKKSFASERPSNTEHEAIFMGWEGGFVVCKCQARALFVSSNVRKIRTPGSVLSAPEWPVAFLVRVRKKERGRGKLAPKSPVWGPQRRVGPSGRAWGL